MIKSVNNYPITQIFDIDTRVIYTVPRYQREYSWRKEDCENLFDDILENDPGYFLGTIICINQSTDTHSVQQLELVDGQQRITTISLLFAAIYDFLKTHEFGLDDEQRAELFNLLHKLVLKKTNEQIRLTPQIQNNNYDDYLYILSRIGVVIRNRRAQVMSCSLNNAAVFQKLADKIFSLPISHSRLRNESSPSLSGFNSKIERGKPTHSGSTIKCTECLTLSKADLKMGTS